MDHDPMSEGICIDQALPIHPNDSKVWVVHIKGKGTVLEVGGPSTSISELIRRYRIDHPNTPMLFRPVDYGSFKVVEPQAFGCHDPRGANEQYRIFLDPSNELFS